MRFVVAYYTYNGKTAVVREHDIPLEHVLPVELWDEYWDWAAEAGVYLVSTLDGCGRTDDSVGGCIGLDAAEDQARDLLRVPDGEVMEEHNLPPM